VQVQSELSVLMEVGLVKGVNSELKGSLGPGPDYRAFQIIHGLNTVPADIAREWFRVNRRFLACIRSGKIRILDSVSQAETEETAA
jgi:hypothetical protein